MSSYSEKCEKLIEQITTYAKKDMAVAFSGGVDSSLVLKLACEAAKENGTKVYAVTVHTKLHPTEDLDIARQAAEETGAIHKVIVLDELADADIACNPIDRCYRCKKTLFGRIIKLTKELEIPAILEGTNEDDLHVYRPGIRALKELGISSPLADCGFTKEEVRRLAVAYEISTASRPSAPCLATRFPYGTKLSYELMEKVDQAEVYLRQLGFYNVRVRVHGEIARIEVDTSDLEKILDRKKEITDYMTGLGFSYITLDLEGFRSGSMDKGRTE